MMLPSITIWIALFVVRSAVCEQRIIRIQTNEVLKMQNNKYPMTDRNVNDMWMIGTSKGGAIKLQCDDIRIFSKNCDHNYLMISAGDTPQKICDVRNNFTVISLFESLYVQLALKNNVDGAFRCEAIGLPSPAPIETHQRVIHIKPDTHNDEVKHHEFLRVKLYEYVVTTDPGYKLIAKCSLGHLDSADKDACNALSLIFKSGSKELEECESNNDLLFLSEDEEMEINLKTGLGVGYGFLFCDIRSISTDGSYSNYKEIASEEFDSSEDGLITNTGHNKPTTCNCGWANKDSKRIIFGHDTGEHEYPWSVSLQTLNGFHFCGGSIISQYHVLTAAHCIGEKKEIQVVMGTNNLNDRRYVIRSKEIIAKDYIREFVKNDIAIIVLEKKIEFNEFIGPVCLPSKEPQIDHQYVTAMGWGQLGEGEYPLKDPNLQKETKLRVVDLFSCTVDWNFKWSLEDAKVMCTWSHRTDICMGDSGGPVVWLDPETNRYTLVGMPALCDGCRLTKPSIHTSVYHFYDWIQSKIKESIQPHGKTCTKV